MSSRKPRPPSMVNARIAMPVYVRRNITRKAAAETEMTMTGLVLRGLTLIGITVDQADHERRYRPPVLDLGERDGADIIGTQLRLSHGLRQRIRHYELRHGLTLKQVVFEALRAAGVEIEDKDLVRPDWAANARGRAAA